MLIYRGDVEWKLRLSPDCGFTDQETYFKWRATKMDELFCELKPLLTFL